MKPPRGIMPEFIWREYRIDELRKAIIRYHAAGLPSPEEWTEEHKRHILWLHQKEVKKKCQN